MRMSLHSLRAYEKRYTENTRSTSRRRGDSERPRSNCRRPWSRHKQRARDGRTEMWASDDRADRREIPDQIERSRPVAVKTPMSEQAQLESYPRRNIKPGQYGANLVFDPAGARKQQDQTSGSPQGARQRDEETLRCPAKEPVAVIQSRQDQCPNDRQSDRRIDRSWRMWKKHVRISLVTWSV